MTRKKAVNTFFVLAILLANTAIYYYSIQSDIHQFTCEVMSPGYPDYIAEQIVCSINGVAIRKLVSMVLFGFFTFLFIYGLFGTIIEARNITHSTRLLRMCDQVFDVDEVQSSENHRKQFYPILIHK